MFPEEGLLLFCPRKGFFFLREETFTRKRKVFHQLPLPNDLLRA